MDSQDKWSVGPDIVRMGRYGNVLFVLVLLFDDQSAAFCFYDDPVQIAGTAFQFDGAVPALPVNNIGYGRRGDLCHVAHLDGPGRAVVRCLRLAVHVTVCLRSLDGDTSFE